MKYINTTACFGAALVFLCWILPVSAEIQTTDSLDSYRVKALNYIGAPDSKAKSLIDGLMDVVHSDRELLNIPPEERMALLVSTVSNNDYEMFKAVWSLDGRWTKDNVTGLLAVAEQREESREWVRLINASWDDLTKIQEYQALLDSIDRGFLAYQTQFHSFANALKEGDLPQYLRQRGRRGDLFHTLALNSDNSLFKAELGRWYVFLIDSFSSVEDVALGGISYEEMPFALRSARASMTAEELNRLIFKEENKDGPAREGFNRVMVNTAVIGAVGGLTTAALASLGGFLGGSIGGVITGDSLHVGRSALIALLAGIVIGTPIAAAGGLAWSLMKEADFHRKNPSSFNSGACKKAISGYLKQQGLEAVPL